MFLRIYDLRAKFLINYQMVFLGQMYMKFSNFANNYYQQYYNRLILIQQPLSEEHSHYCFLQLFYFQCFQVISLFNVLKVQDNIHF